MNTLLLKEAGGTYDATAKLVRSPIRWPGGKALLAKQIVPLLPAHTCYVEVFGGGLAILCNKARSKVEVVNDIDQELVNFYRCVRFHLEPLLQELEWVLNSRAQFEEFKAQPGLTDIQRAARWFWQNCTGFGGKGEHFGTHTSRSVVSRSSRLESIDKLSQRLEKVIIENLDWRECFRRYDREHTLFFCDPPYVHGCGYSTPWKSDDHQQLAHTIKALKGQWLLTYDDCSEVRDLYQGCRFTEVVTKKGIYNQQGAVLGALQQLIIQPGGGRFDP